MKMFVQFLSLVVDGKTRVFIDKGTRTRTRYEFECVTELCFVSQE
jgi:hypothetical protein